MTIDEMIAVLLASKEGKQIESRRIDGDGEWRTPFPGWDFTYFEYRVRTDPMEIEVWVIEDDNYVEIARNYHDPSHYKGWAKKKFREVIE